MLKRTLLVGSVLVIVSACGGAGEAPPAEAAAARADVPFQAQADPVLEAAIQKASPSYVKDAVDPTDRSRWARYIYNRVDLNADGRDESLVYLLGPDFCGTGGCSLLVFTPAADGLTLVNAFSVTRTPVIVSPMKTNGWNDLIRPESGGGAPASHVRHTFDGKQYVEGERMPADSAPDGTRYLAGELGPDTGVPLAPADQAAPGSAPAAPAPSASGFATVCGVTVEGKEYRYRCTVEGAAPGTSGQTELIMPDNRVTIAWAGAGKATATFAGMVPREITVTTKDGVTSFRFDDTVYFFASDRTVAAGQLKSLR